MRLRTLPVSTAGVFASWAIAADSPVFRWIPAVICLLFAVGAQIASNFAMSIMITVTVWIVRDDRGRDGVSQRETFPQRQ